MITYTMADADGVRNLDQPEKQCWIHLVNPSDSEVAQISELTGVPDLMLKSALDEEESAHIDREDDNLLVVVDVPSVEEENDNFVYTTMPMGFVLSPDYTVTISLRETTLLTDFMNQRVKGFSTRNPLRFLLQVLYRNATKFLQHLRQIDRSSHRLQAELHRSMKNKELILLLELEKSLVYFSTSLRANKVVIEKISRFESIKSDSDERDLLDDLVIENEQAIEMCNIYRDILSGTMDAFASIISNNVNLVMKILTVITIILTIPSLIAALWGMNVPVPFGDNPLGFLIVIGITLVITVPVAWLLIRLTNRLRSNPPRERKRKD